MQFIVSQNEKVSVNTEYVSLLSLENSGNKTKVVAQVEHYGKVTLGVFDTEQRAKEVMDFFIEAWDSDIPKLTMPLE